MLGNNKYICVNLKLLTMQLKGFILLPVKFTDNSVKYEMTMLSYSTPQGERVYFDVIKVNCPSLLEMKDVVSEYFKEAVNSPATEANILKASYLGMMNFLFNIKPNGQEIHPDILNVMHQADNLRHIKKDSGYHFEFQQKDWVNVQNTVAKSMREKR